MTMTENSSKIQAELKATAGGAACTLCEATGPVIPWAGERVCLRCMDTQLDLLAKAFIQLEDVPVTVGAGVRTPGHVTRIEA
jgi:hypothetical protein